MRLTLLLVSVAVLLLGSGCATAHRKLLFHPTHHAPSQRLTEWKCKNHPIGFARTVLGPGNVWLLVHGNGGQAADREYALACFSAGDSVYILEYPGYGGRAGTPSLTSCNAAAKEAYEFLRAEFPNTPVCVAAESIGTGPACVLAGLPRPPDKIILVVPFDILSTVVSDHLAFLPSGLLLRDNWNNIEALRSYRGPLEIFAAAGDTTISIRHAKALAATKPQAIFHEFPGDHNDWPTGGRVTFSNP